MNANKMIQFVMKFNVKINGSKDILIVILIFIDI